MLLLADWVLPVSSTAFAEGGVRVEGAAITAVGPAAELRGRFPGDEVRFYPGCVLMPGLVNVHTHLEYSAFRGFAPPSAFGTWMLRLLLARRRLDPADYQVAALWGAYECARCGVTTVADCAFTGEAVARAARAAGLRARVYQEVFGLDDGRLPETMRSLEMRLERIRQEGGSLVEPGVSPHAPYTVSARLYREAARFARRAGLFLATHVAESPAEVELLLKGRGAIARAYRLAGLWSGRRWRPPGLTPVRYLSETGALGPRTLAVHAVQVQQEEILLLADSGAAVAHCPRSNARLGCGTAPVIDMLQQGVPVGLGTDSLASNDDLDLFSEMRAAQRASAGRLTAQDIIKAATLEAAIALGWNHLVGSLEPGKQADIIAVRLPGHGENSVSACAEDRPIDERVVEHATAVDVVLTMVGGRILEESGSASSELAPRLTAIRAKLSSSSGVRWGRLRDRRWPRHPD